MAARPPRHSLIPNANSPQLLFRLLEAVGQGVREPRALAEVLDCEVRTVHYYTQAGAWLNLLETDARGHRPQLTRVGMDLVFAGRQRVEVYARAVWANEFVAQLMAGRHALPEADEIGAFIQRLNPEMAESTARRRATSVRSLIEPAMRYPKRRDPPGHQMDLNFTAATRRPPPPDHLDLRAGVEESPDVYRLLFRALLDHGELSLGQVRAILDRSGGGEVPIGGYARMALRRGDAFQVGDRLVASWGAVWRRDLAETVAGIALSDPRYRDYLKVLREAAAGDPGAGVRYGQLRDRFSSWDRRVFGESISPARLAQDLDRVLLGRPIDAFPLAGDAGPEPGEATGPFLDLLDRGDLVLSVPPGLAEVRGGVTRINQLLEGQRGHKNDVDLPTVVDRRILVHGGLCHPGEPKPRAIPDNVSLRLRLLCNVPHAAMTVALLVLHRRTDWRRRLVMRPGGVDLREGTRTLGELFFLLDEFASEQGWLVARRPRAGLSSEELAEVLEGLGIATRLGDLLALEEGFYVRLQTDVEDREVYDRLLPLVDRLQQFVEGWSAER